MPVLVLTARASWHEKVQGIDGGADDYVAKPFRIEEVLARLVSRDDTLRQALHEERDGVLEDGEHQAMLARAFCGAPGLGATREVMKPVVL